MVKIVVDNKLKEITNNITSIEIGNIIITVENMIDVIDRINERIVHQYYIYPIYTDLLKLKIIKIVDYRDSYKIIEPDYNYDIVVKLFDLKG